MSELLVALFRHNTWANVRLFEFCRDLDESKRESQTTVEGTRGPVRDTLLHLAQAQEYYLSVFGKIERPTDPSFPGWDALLERVRRSSEGFEALASELPGDDYEIDASLRGQSVKLHASVVLTQAINHATDHRSQVATVLTQMGVEPPLMDSWTFARADGRMQ